MGLSGCLRRWILALVAMVALAQPSVEKFIGTADWMPSRVVKVGLLGDSKGRPNWEEMWRTLVEVSPSPTPLPGHAASCHTPLSPL